MFSLKILSRYTNLYLLDLNLLRVYHAKTKQVRSTLLFIACQNTRKPITENTQLRQSYHHICSPVYPSLVFNLRQRYTSHRRFHAT